MTKQANIKLPSKTLGELKRLTGEATGQKAAEQAILYFLQEARQRDILEFLKSPRFRDGFDPIALRKHDR